MNEYKHIITSVVPDSIAFELEIEVGDILLSVNGNTIKDVFDYHFMINEDFLVLLILKQNGEEWELEIEKGIDEDIGIGFEEGMMDSYISCTNKCMFCFIDQMPPGMRDTLYFKDDDSRLSFLQGNYITLTNMKDEDIERIIQYKLSPINISVHTTNKELRCKMLKNRFAGDSLDNIKKLYDAHIEMNSQIVLCKGYNDGEELEHTIEELSSFLPYMMSLSIVPVGITKFREGLVPLEKFKQDDALEVLEIIHQWQKKILKKHHTRFIHASDEWYLTAKLPIPEAEHYEGYNQIENGVGMVRSLVDEFDEYYNTLIGTSIRKKVSLATGVLAAPIISNMTCKLKDKYPNIEINVYTIENDFFGKDITVAGLLTGVDIINQLKNLDLGDFLILPRVLLRTNEDVLLDDLTVSDLEKALQINIRIADSDAKSLIDNIIKTI